MKAEFNSTGNILITPENTIERYALRDWSTRRETGHVDRPAIVVNLTPPPMPPTSPADERYVKTF